MGQTITSTADLTIFGLEDPISDETVRFVPGVLEIQADIADDLKDNITCKCPIPTHNICMENNLCEVTPSPAAPTDDVAASLKEAQRLRDEKLAQNEENAKLEQQIGREEENTLELEKVATIQQQTAEIAKAEQDRLLEEEAVEMVETAAPQELNENVQMCQRQVDNLAGTVTKETFLGMYGEDCGAYAGQINWTKLM